jgi:hypothetical protein
MNEQNKLVDDARRRILDVCSKNSRFCRCPKLFQEEIRHELLVKIFRRKIRQSLVFNSNYVSKLLKFELRIKPYRDPYVKQQKLKHEETQKWGPAGQETGTTRRSPEQEPLLCLIQKEEEFEKSEKLKWIRKQIGLHSPKKQVLMQKYLRGEKTSNHERSAKFRIVKELKAIAFKS